MNSKFSVESILNDDRRFSSANTSNLNLSIQSTNEFTPKQQFIQNFESNNHLNNVNFNTYPLDSLPHLTNTNPFNESTNSNIEFNSNLRRQFSSNIHENYDDFNQHPFKKLKKFDFVNKFNDPNCSTQNIIQPLLLNQANHNSNSSFKKNQPIVRNNEFSLNLDNTILPFHLQAPSINFNEIQSQFLSSKSNESTFSSSNQGIQLKNKDKSSCSRCKLHGQYSELKNHKNKCPFLNCSCDVCKLYKNTNKLRRKNVDDLINKTSSNYQESSNSDINLNNLNKNFNLPDFFNFEQNNGSPTNFVEKQSINSINQRNVSPFNVELNKSYIPIDPLNSNSLENQLDYLNNSEIENNANQVIDILKEKLIKDELNYEQELPKLKFAVIGMLLQKYDKNELFYKLKSLLEN